MPQEDSHNKFGQLFEGRIIVADTSSLLIAGTSLLTTLYDCQFVIPSVVVQELEAKRTHPTLGYMARQWINLLEDLRLSNGAKLSLGVPYEDTNILIRVEPNHSRQTTLPKHLQDGSVDSTILAVAHNLQKDDEIKDEVVLLSNDTPMRLHATLDLDFKAYEFNSAILLGDKRYKARVKLIMTDKDFARIGLTEHSTDFSSLGEFLTDEIRQGLGHHSMLDIFIESESSPVLTLRYENGAFYKIERKLASEKIVGRTLEQDVALHYLKSSSDEIPIVSIIGSAGTGKTLLTVATALDEIKAKKYQKIVVFRSLHEMGQGQEMGFLPGDVNDKMGPWSGAIRDALDVIAERRKPAKKNEGPQAVEDRKKYAEKLSESIEVSPITYLRGRSLAKSFIILDEAQNFSRTELLNIISRVGEGSKIVILADDAQVDNRFLQSGSKADIWSVISGFKEYAEFAHVSLMKTERSKLAELASRMLEVEGPF